MIETNNPPRRSDGILHRRRERLDWHSDQPFRILSLDGGGIRGIFSAAILADLESTYLGGDSVAEYFDLITGTSTGGILALGLAAGMTAGELLDLYITRGREIFPPERRALRKIRQYFFTPTDGRPWTEFWRKFSGLLNYATRKCAFASLHWIGNTVTYTSSRPHTTPTIRKTATRPWRR